MGNPCTGALVPVALRAWIKAAYKHGMVLPKICEQANLSENTVRAVLLNYDETGDQIAETAAEGLKRALPARLREVASAMLDRLADPEVQAGMSGKDLSIALGILMDKATMLETSGAQTSVLIQIQTRVDSAISGKIADAEIIEVQPVKPALPEPKPRQKRKEKL